MTDDRAATSRSRPRSPPRLILAVLSVRAPDPLRWAALALEPTVCGGQRLESVDCTCPPAGPGRARYALGAIALSCVAVSASLGAVRAEATAGKAMTDTSPAATRAT